jgi:hypothetical protein
VLLEALLKTLLKVLLEVLLKLCFCGRQRQRQR